MPPVVNIACSTITQVFYPWGVRQIGGILHIGMQCGRRCAWEECVLLKGTRLVRQNADGIQRCATACTAWVQTGVANKECVLTA